MLSAGCRSSANLAGPPRLMMSLSVTIVSYLLWVSLVFRGFGLTLPGIFGPQPAPSAVSRFLDAWAIVFASAAIVLAASIAAQWWHLRIVEVIWIGSGLAFCGGAFILQGISWPALFMMAVGLLVMKAINVSLLRAA